MKKTASDTATPTQETLDDYRRRKRARKGASFDFIDLFAGIGGLRLGFESIGGRCVFTSEWNAKAQETYRANFPDEHPLNGDIREVDAHADIPPFDVLLAGFPCQPFWVRIFGRDALLS